MHGFGVMPSLVRLHVRVDDVLVEVVGEVEHQVVDAQLLRHAAGVVDVGHRAAAGVAVAAPQPHGDAHHLVAVAQQLGRGDRRVDAAAERHQHLHDAPPSRRRTRRSRCDGAARRPRRRGRHRPRWWWRPSVRRSAPSASSRGTPIAASTCDGSIAPPRTPTPRWRTRPPRRAGTAAPRSRCPRCTRAPSRPPCASRGTVSCTPGSSRRRARRPAGRAAQRCAAARSARSTIGEPQRLGHRDDAGHVVRAAAPLALLPAADEHRLERDAARGRPARRRPSAHRTCAPTATAGRRAARWCAGRASTAACTASVCSTAPRRVLAHDRGHRGQVVDRADLVVDRHHADHRHVGRGAPAHRPARRGRRRRSR